MTKSKKLKVLHQKDTFRNFTIYRFKLNNFFCLYFNLWCSLYNSNYLSSNQLIFNICKN